MEDKKEVYYKYFEEKILPLIYPLEKERIKTVWKVVISSIIMFLAGIFFAFLFVYLALTNKISLLWLPVLLFLMYLFFIKSIINVIWAGKNYQKLLLEKVLPYFFEPYAKFRFWPKNHDTGAVLDSKLFGNFDSQEDTACIFGIYNNVNVIVANTELTIPINKKVFKGTTVQLELPASIDNHVIMLSKNERKNNTYKQVNPHIKDLNKYLYTFAKNPDRVDFIDEDFWKILKRFGEVYTAKGFAFSYKNRTVLIAIRQKRPWQFGFLFKSLLKPENYDDLIERFVVIFDFVDLLNRSA